MSEEKYVLSTSASAIPAMTNINDFATLLRHMDLHPVTNELPDDYLNAIGRMISQWALHEWLIVGIICLILDIDRKEARIAVGNPRAKDTLKRIKQLCRVKEIPVPNNMPTATMLEHAEAARNLVGHGIWLRNNATGKLCIQDVGGSWKFEPPEKDVSKNLYPEAKDIDENWFNEQLTLMARCIEATDKSYKELEATLAPLRKRAS